ncbi:MAG TPA: glycerophosphodiester phosphodiesterase family protein, partial [Pseudomonadales bacterium]
ENAWDETYERGDDGGWTRYDYDWMRTPEGLRQLAGTVAGVGPAYAMLVDVQGDVARPNGFVAAAHEAGLVVHPFTFRSDVLPPYAATFDALLRLFTEVAGVDGVFTDFPDKALYFLQNTRAAAP